MKLLILLLAGGILGLSGCVPNEDLDPVVLASPSHFRLIQLGDKLENPFSVENMRRAYRDLSANDTAFVSQGSAEEAIPTTHLYIRFLPANDTELAVLERDSALILYEYPLDVEIVEGGNYYHDPSLLEDQPTYQYCAVSVKQILPTSVDYEVLANLCLPHSPNLKEVFDFDVYTLLAKSFALTGNEYTGPVSEAIQAKWRPNGRIRVRDWFYNGVENVSIDNPVVGAKVRARSWFTTITATTYTTGYFSGNGTLSGKAEYSIVWESDDWDIRTGSLSQAVLVGPKIEGSWNLIITNTLDRWQAIVHLAAYDYYYRNIHGIKTPPKNSFWSSKVKISTYDEVRGENGLHCAPCRFGGLVPRIFLYNPNRSTDLLYGTTIHELAHASHWELRRGDWDGDQIERRLKESWAEGVAWLFTWNRYQQYSSAYAFKDNYQLRRLSTFPVFTSLFVDLVDDFNQSLLDLNVDYPTDRVKNYSFNQFESVLINSDGFSDLKNELEFRYNNETEFFLDELFNNWHP